MKFDYTKLGALAGSIGSSIADSQGASSGLSSLIGHALAMIPQLIDRALSGDLEAQAKLRDILGSESRSAIERAVDDEAKLAKFGPDE